MKTYTKVFRALSAVLLMIALFTINANAQCTNPFQFGSGAVPSVGGVTTTLTTCAFTEEYSLMTGAVSGQTLTVTGTSSVISPIFLTVHSGTFDGPVVAFGNSPLTFVNTFTGTLFLHYNNNAACGQNGAGCVTGTVTCNSCAGPSGCTNPFQFGAGTIPANNSIVTLTTCAFTSEYSVIFGAVSGQTLSVTGTSGFISPIFLTVHSGTFDGPVVAFGNSPLTFVNTFTGTLFLHYNNNSACGQGGAGCVTGTVQCVSCAAAAPPNDLICNATLISGCSTIPTSISGTTINATTTGETLLPFCGTSGGSAGGVWYQWTGVTVGASVMLNTCTGTGYDSKIHVFSSSNNTCTGIMTCIAGNDDFCGNGLQSQVNFVSPSTTLFVYVHGFSTATGAFVLTRTCNPVAFNPCTSVTNIPACDVDISTVIASGNGAFALGPFIPPGQEKIYTFTPAITGTYFIQQSQNTGFWWVDYFFKPVSGGCNALGWTFVQDLISAPNTSFIGMALTAGTSYYIMLDPEHTGGTSVTFRLICPAPPPANDFCTTAIPISLTCGTATVVTGNTSGATTDLSDSNPFCGNSAAKSVWYSIVGSGNDVIVNTCGGSPYDTWLSAYSGTCGALTCLVNNDDFCGLQSQIQFSTVLGQTYYIRVHGFSTASGAFTMSIACLAACSPAVTTVMNPPSGCGTVVPTVASLTGLPIGATIQWQFQVDGAGPWFDIFGANFQPILLNANLGTGIQEASLGLRAIVNGGCLTVPHVFVINSPFPATQPTGLSGCGAVSGNVSVLANPTPGYQVRWYNAPTGGTLLGTGNPFAVNVSSTTTFYAATFNPATGCESATRVGATVTSHPIPVVTVNATPNPVCAGTTLSLTASAQTGPTCAGGTFTVTVSGTGFLDETTWQLRNSSNVIVASGGPFGFGTTNTINAPITLANVPLTFTIETQGTFNDNIAAWSVSCGGPNIVFGSINGGLTTTTASFCCGGLTGGGGGSGATVPVGITVSGTGFLDETTWQVLSATSTVLGSGGPYGFGSTNASVVNVPSGVPFSFVIETQGFFNDNVASFNIVCEGGSIASGTVPGGQSQTSSNLLCGPPPIAAGWSWTGPNGFTSTNQNPTLTAVAASEGTYSATFTTPQGCNGSNSVAVVVNEAPNIVSLQSATLNGGAASSFPTPPSFLDIPAFTEILTCDKVVDYSLNITGEPTPTESYTFSGATLGSGSGTGSGSTFGRLIPTGRTTVTVTSTNICGSQAKTFRVTVTDNVAPVITPIQVAATNTNGGECASLVQVTQPDLLNGGLFDNCPNSSLIFVSRSDGRSQFEPYFAGTTTVTWQATDASANTSIATQDVVVVNLKPLITSFAADGGNIIFTNQTSTFTVNFTDEDGGGTHTVKYYRDKNDAVPADTKVIGPSCTQSCNGTRNYVVTSEPILFSTSMVSEPKVEVLDGCNTAADQEPGVSTIQYFAVAVPGQQFTTGGGHFDMPAGGFPSAYEGFQVNIGNVVKKATSGNSFKGQLEMNVHIPGLPDWRVHTDNGTNQDITWDYLTIAGCSLATFKGAVRINGQTGYKVLVQQSDKDRNPATSNFMRVKVTTNGGALIFDTQPGLTEALTSGNGGAAAIIVALDGGAIKVQPSSTQNQACTSRMEGLSAEGDILQNLPNPFTGQTEIRFSIPADGKYTLKVYNYLGQEVSTLFDGEASGGSMHSVMFDGSNHQGGIYTYTLAGANVSETRRMNLVK